MAAEETWNEILAAGWEALDSGGWEYLLPGTVGARWLTVDATGGATSALLAGAVADVTIVPADPAQREHIAARLALLALPNARLAPAGPMPRAAADGRPFDGFVLHDLVGVMGRAEVGRVLAHAREAVSPRGCIHVALRNRFGYPRLLRGRQWLFARAGQPYFRPSEITRAIARRPAEVHACISNAEGRLLDVITPAGYVSAQNPGARGERLRRALLGPRGARWLAPAFIVLTRGVEGGPSFLEAAVAALERRRGVPPGAFAVRRYHCLRGGKVVVWVGSPTDDRERFIFVLARARVAIARRRREFELLERLGRLPREIARYVPRPEFQEELAGARLFVMGELAGVTLEADVTGLETATREGAEFLLRLHRATRAGCCMTPEAFEALCGSIFEAAETRYPVLRPRLARLREAVRGALEGLEVPTVWLHGDFKVENLVVESDTGRLVGVIDWELAEPEGLPLLDLWFLLLYNRRIREGTPFFPGVGFLLSPGAMRPDESAMCERYVRELGVPARALPSLAAMMIVHHCARRMFYDNQDTPMMERISLAIEESLRSIAAGRAAHA